MKTTEAARVEAGRVSSAESKHSIQSLICAALRWLLLLFAIALPAGAAKRVNVAQLENLLTEARAKHKPDTDLGRQIGGMELTERLTEATLDRLITSLALGPEAAQALQLLADQSAFLNPPANEFPALAVPSDVDQQRMLDAMRDYVARTLFLLPNLLATRTTRLFDDSPRAATENGWPIRTGLHLVGTSTGEISVRGDREIMSVAAGGAAQEQAKNGLTSWGEFGPMLAMILADTAGRPITWSHWEHTSGGAIAAFHYSVPRSSSHFAITGSLEQRASATGSSIASAGRSVPQQNLDLSRATPFTITPAYHGLLWLDPVTGTVLRVSIQAELKVRDPVERADMLVQYGPIEIGGRSFVGPVQSLSLRIDPINSDDSSGAPPLLRLNETQFTNYHRFASTVQMLPGKSP